MEVNMPEAHKRAYRHPKYKTSYRIKNWSEYEQSLRNRGDITIWLSQDAIDAWTPPKNGKRGGQPIYSDIAIETSILLRLVFHLPLRQAEGFLKSICRVMRKTHSIVTRESLGNGWELRMMMLRSWKLRLVALSWIGCSKWVNLCRMRLDRIVCQRERCPCFRFMQQSPFPVISNQFL